jgi:hypothetical protein
VIDRDGVIESAADAERVARYVDTFLLVLWSDDRVQAEFSRWRDQNDLVGRTFESGPAFKEACVRNHARDLAHLDAFVRDTLTFPHDWLAERLLLDFRIAETAARTGHGSLVAISDPDVTGLPAGKRWGVLTDADRKRHRKQPRVHSQIDHVLRDVTFFYRKRIKQPQDSMGVLVREWDLAYGGCVDPESNVKKAIERARRNLSALQITPQ